MLNGSNLSKLSPFDFVNSINSPSKQNLMENNIEAKKSYLPYIINRQFSYFRDTVLLANEMNASNKLDAQMQYDFYRHTVRPQKRFSKWIKPEQIEDLNTISRYYGISQENAKSALSILSKDTIKSMKNMILRGGMSKDK